MTSFSEVADHQGAAIFGSTAGEVDLLDVSQQRFGERLEHDLLEAQLGERFARERGGGDVYHYLAAVLTGQLERLTPQLQRYTLTSVSENKHIQRLHIEYDA